jgi:uncharacterized protein (TIGR03000 family)
MRSIVLFAILSVGGLGLDVGKLAAAPPGDAPATIEDSLPADAQLTVDGVATRSTSSRRSFITPPLKPGTSFHYTFRAQIVREGKTITIEKQVFVRAGLETAVSLDVPSSRRTTYGAEAPSDLQEVAPVRPTMNESWQRNLPTIRSEDRSYTPGFNPSRWGSDPSDGFYHGREW